MIYTSFIYLLIAIALFSGASGSDSHLLPLVGDFVLTLFLYLFFVVTVRQQLRWIRVSRQDTLEANLEAQETRIKLFGRYRLVSMIFYAVSVYLFDLKALLMRIPGVEQFEVLQNLFGVGAFVLYWCILWYWEYREGDAPPEIESASHYIKGQLAVQFGVFIPWLILNLLLDLLLRLPIPGLSSWMGEPLFQLIFFALFFLLLIVLSPLIMIKLWRCQPLQDESLRTEIETFCQSHGVRFRGVLSWDALGGGLITADVIGLFPIYRYLLITPRLRQILSRDELMAVVAHEIAHVKRRHLLHYFVFILGFVLISMGSIQRLLLLFFNTSMGQAIIFNSNGELRADWITFMYVFLSLYFLVFYFRFVFGYFMRHFERQADLFPVEQGMKSSALVSAFEKLAQVVGDDGSRKNWHHFTLPERIGMVESAAVDPEIIRRHTRSLRRSLAIYWGAILLLAIFLYAPFSGDGNQARDLQLYAQILERQLQADPHNQRSRLALAGVYYELERWLDSERAYLAVLDDNPNQVVALNNLAWLYLTSEESSLRNPQKALLMARKAVTLDYNPTNIDTLAEACYQTERFEEAYKLSREAFRMVEVDVDDHFAKQLKKMEKAWQENRLLDDGNPFPKTL